MDLGIDKKLALMSLLLTRDQGVGRTALNKLLFFCDVAHYLHAGETISDTKYFKLDYGPVPENINKTRNVLIDNGFMAAYVTPVGQYVQNTYQASDNLTVEDWDKIGRLFTPDQYEIIEKVKTGLQNKSARHLSDISHEFEPWKGADWHAALDFERAKTDETLKAFLKEHSISV